MDATPALISTEIDIIQCEHGITCDMV